MITKATLLAAGVVARPDRCSLRALDNEARAAVGAFGRTQIRLPFQGPGALARSNNLINASEQLPVTDVERLAGSGATRCRRYRLFRIARERLSSVVLAACCLFVAVVSVHDATLVVLNAAIIGEVERNPLGRWLIEIQGGEVWLFVLLKLVGTAVVCAVLVTLYQCRARLAVIAGGGVAAFQMGLLWYLTFAKAI